MGLHAILPFLRSTSGMRASCVVGEIHIIIARSVGLRKSVRNWWSEIAAPHILPPLGRMDFLVFDMAPRLSRLRQRQNLLEVGRAGAGRSFVDAKWC